MILISGFRIRLVGCQLSRVSDWNMNILLDMNLSPKFEKLFLQKGVEAVHWQKIGPPDAKDIVIME